MTARGSGSISAIATAAPSATPSSLRRSGRPASAQQDRTLTLSAASDGGYGAETVLGRGIWEADLSVVAGGETPWTRQIRFTVR